MRVSVLGAGRSSGYLIEYLSQLIGNQIESLFVYDLSFDSLWKDFSKSELINYEILDLGSAQKLESVIIQSDIVVCMMPPTFHVQVAKICLKIKVHLFTASYVSEDMYKLHSEAKEKGILFMNELGLDPGIDHLSASKFIEELRSKGAIIKGFKSYCGGLVTKSSNNLNPWQYKITWNPMNVVTAGQGGPSKWRDGTLNKSVLPENLFREAIEINLENGDAFDAYPNRDSLSYQSVYQMQDVDTLIRGTLRRKGFCVAWQWLVDLKATESKTFSELGTPPQSNETFEKWIIRHSKLGVETLLNIEFNSADVRDKIEFLKLNDYVISSNDNSPAQVLLRVLTDKWKLLNTDIDEVVMIHQTDYVLNNQKWRLESTMIVKGEGSGRTAMAKTVGLPLAIGVEMLINNEIQDRGVVIPVFKPWGNQLLNQLEKRGIVFSHRNFPHSNY